MNDLNLQAEHQKLARLLGCPESTVAALSGLDVSALRQLRAACTSLLFDGDRTRLQRVAAAARLLPGALSAVVAEKAMGPVLASRVAGLLPPKDAVDIARRVPLAFNVQVTLQIDPRSAVDMLKLMPLDIVLGVTRALCAQREYITMARFVDALTDEQIRATMNVLDDEALLRTGFFVESPQRLEELVGLLSPARLQSVVAVSAQSEELGGAVLVLLAGVSERLRLRLAEAALSHADGKVGAQLVATARHHGMIGLLAPLAAQMQPAAGTRLKELLA